MAVNPASSRPPKAALLVAQRIVQAAMGRGGPDARAHRRLRALREAPFPQTLNKTVPWGTRSFGRRPGNRHHRGVQSP